MLHMTVNSEEKLLKERDRIQSVLMDMLGRAPKGGLMDQLTAKIWNQPNFETAMALASRQDEQPYSFDGAAKGALDTLGIKDAQGSLESLINTSVLNMDTEVFNVPRDELQHKVMLIAIYHYIHEKYKNVVLDSEVKYLEKFWLDYDLYKTATKKSGYNFYSAIDSSTTSMAKVAINWVEQGYIRSDCSIVGMVHYDAFRLLKNALGEHSCFNLGFDLFASVSALIEQQLLIGGKLDDLKEKVSRKDTNGALELLRDHAEDLVTRVNGHISQEFTYVTANDQLTITRSITESDRSLQVVVTISATKRGSYKVDYYYMNGNGSSSKKRRKVSMIDDVSNAYYPMQNARNIAGSLQATINVSTI